MKNKEQVITTIRAQLAVAKEIGSDFISLTTGEGKALLSLLQQPDKEWISVEDTLPVGDWQECWVWAEDFEEPDRDEWVNDRGQPRRWANGPEEDKDFIASGWYANTGNKITHWMPIDTPKRPLPPKK